MASGHITSGGPADPLAEAGPLAEADPLATHGQEDARAKETGAGEARLLEPGY